jgi:hypothetical protein
MAKAKKEKKAPWRPLKYGEETVMYRRRVPKSHKEKIEKLVEGYLKKLEV